MPANVHHQLIEFISNLKTKWNIMHTLQISSHPRTEQFLTISNNICSFISE